MTKQVVWTKAILTAFIEEGNLNDRQQFIMKTRSEGMSIIEQAEKLHLSTDQVNKEISQLKKIYDIVQKTSNVLPERKKDQKELFDIK